MFFARRTALLRFVAMVGLATSAVLTADSLHPDRAFCPLEAACSKARESALGEIAGIPTSVIGIGAFSVLFALTLLPLSWARKCLRPVGVIAALAGQGFILYQAFALGTFCPLCVVADGSALLAALIILTWPPLPVYLSGKRMPGEPPRRRSAWVLGAMAATFLPFAWPRSTAPAWVEITPLSDDEVALESASLTAPPPVEERTGDPALPEERRNGVLFIDTEDGALPSPSATALSIFPDPTPVVALTEPARLEPPPVRPAPPVRTAPPKPAPVETEPASEPAPKTHRPLPREATHPELRPEKPAPPPPDEPQVRIVEYLNAYCTHCRATHSRLDRVLHATKVKVKRRRVYTWASNDYPMWARACAYAATVGLEDRMFEELLKTRNTSAREVFAAARRAGVDVAELRKAVNAARPPPRLVRDKDLQRRAGLRGLPTLDIGRRRLMGEQSEAELAAAIRAALTAGSS